MGNWIKSAIKHPGGLHKALGVPMGQPIPEKKMAQAGRSDNAHLQRMVSLAKTLKGFHK